MSKYLTLRRCQGAIPSLLGKNAPYVVVAPYPIWIDGENWWEAELSLLLFFFGYKFFQVLKSLKRSGSAAATRRDGIGDLATFSTLLMCAKRTFYIGQRPKVVYLH